MKKSPTSPKNNNISLVIDVNKQVEANKRYLAKNPEAKIKKNISAMKSTGKKFILEHATMNDLQQYKTWILQREKMLLEDE